MSREADINDIDRTPERGENVYVWVAAWNTRVWQTSVSHGSLLLRVQISVF
jgi:hypothetical protein